MPIFEPPLVDPFLGPGEWLGCFVVGCDESIDVLVCIRDPVLDQDQVCRCLDETAKQTAPSGKTQSEANRQVTTLSIPARLKRTGKEMRISSSVHTQSAISSSQIEV
jgi:hypothetical protein